MSDRELAGTTALVTGASRGFGRGIATALSRAGAQVVGVARDRGQLADLRAELGGSFTPVPADAADPVVAGQLIDAYRPTVLVLNAGATPLPRPIHHHTWQTFSRNWEVDVQHVFHFTREALLAPLAPVTSAVVPASSRSNIMILRSCGFSHRRSGGLQIQTSRTHGNRRGANQAGVFRRDDWMPGRPVSRGYALLALTSAGGYDPGWEGKCPAGGAGSTRWGRLATRTGHEPTSRI